MNRNSSRFQTSSRKPTLFLILALLACLTACGSGSSGLQPLSCSGSSCNCPSGAACDIAGSDCANASCSLDCTDNNDCTGSCGASCSIDCAQGSTCDVTVGESGSVSCTEGSVCRVACAGNCSLTCSADSTCELTCPGDSASHALSGSGQCAI